MPRHLPQPDPRPSFIYPSTTLDLSQSITIDSTFVIYLCDSLLARLTLTPTMMPCLQSMSNCVLSCHAQHEPKGVPAPLRLA